MDLFNKTLDRINDGLSGGNKGIPIPFKRLRKFWPYILKYTYYLIFAGPKVGKTALADDIFLYNVIQYCQNNPEFDCHISYLSLEIDKVSKALKIISRILFYDKHLELSSKDLLSQNEEGVLDSSILELIKTEYADWFKMFEEKVSIKDKSSSVESIIKWLFYEKNRLMPDWDINPDKYKNFYWIIIIDHLALVGDRIDMERLSRVLLQFRNDYGAIPVVIQQAGLDAENKESRNAFTKNPVRPTPTISDLGDMKYTARDASVIIALFSPHSQNIESFDGFNIKRFGDSFRNLEILRDRDGPTNVNMPLYFVGKVGTFIELPRLDIENGRIKAMSEEDIRYYEERKFLKNGN